MYFCNLGLLGNSFFSPRTAGYTFSFVIIGTRGMLQQTNCETTIEEFSMRRVRKERKTRIDIL